MKNLATPIYKIRKITKAVLLVVVLVVVVVFSAGRSFGDADIDAACIGPYQDCALYDPGCGSSPSTSDTADTSSGDQTAPADGAGSDLPSDIVKAINKLKPDYQAAAEKTKVPWQLLAAVHYREANNNPSQDLQAGNPLGGGGGQFANYPHGAPKSIEQSAEYAAEELINDAKSGVVKKPINVDSPSPEAIKDALFGYNGRASVYADQAAALGFNKNTEPYEGSPYVMNNFDAKHKNMKIITHDFGGLDGVDTRFGAYVIYARLGGENGGTCGSSGAYGNIEAAVQLAIKYSWPDYHAAPYVKMKPEYKAAVDKARSNGEYIGGNAYPGVDCGGFVTRVMRNSGADPNYNWGPHNSKQGPTTSQQAYMDANPDKYEKIGAVSDTSKLKPGDIAINSEHTYMYVGKQSGFNGNSASASLDGRSPMASDAYFTNPAGPFIWYRLK